MTPELIKANIEFLNRAQLQGSEAQAFLAVHQALHEMLFEAEQAEKYSEEKTSD